jgi:hypothetical protein
MILRQMTAQEVMALIGAHEIPNDECYGAINALAREVRRLQKMEEIINEFIVYARECESGYGMYYDDFWRLKELLK